MHNRNTLKFSTKFCLIFFLIVIFRNNIFSQSGKAKSLEIGNRWIYLIDGTGYCQYEVVSDTIINGIKYAVITNLDYERADSNRVYYYSELVPTETILVDFSLEVGDTLNGYTVDCKDFVMIWGKMLKKICLSQDIVGGIFIDKYYVEEIGLTWQEAYGIGVGYRSMELKAALIDDKIYGDTTLLNVKIPQELAPSKFLLFQNYPNPFNPKTVISYRLAVTGKVKITVYDILGKEIATLINNELQSAGMHKIEFDADKYNLSSGVYFYKLKIKSNKSENMVTKKMVYLK